MSIVRLKGLPGVAMGGLVVDMGSLGVAMGWLWGGYGVAYKGKAARFLFSSYVSRPVPCCLVHAAAFTPNTGFLQWNVAAFLRWIWVVEGYLRGMVFIQSNYLARIRHKF